MSLSPRFRSKKLGVTYWVGILTAVAIIFSPSSLFTEHVFFSTQVPSTVFYHLWGAGVSLIDLGLLVFFIITLVAWSRFNALYRPYFGWVFTYFSLSMISLFMQLFNGYDFQYYDGVISIIRSLTVLNLVFFVLNRDAIGSIKIFMSTLCILAAISIIFFSVLGNTSSIAGRINLLGMGPNVSADVLVMFSILSLYMVKRRLVGSAWFFALLVVSLIFVPLAGSRRALLFLVLLLALSFQKRYAILYVGLFFLGLIVFAFSGTRLDLLFSTTGFSRVMDSFELYKLGQFSDGRSDMFKTVMLAIQNNPWGVGISSWAVQSEMAKYGVGSHAHNLFLQFYLYYGFFSVAFLYPLFRVVSILYLNRFHLLLSFLFVSNITGYGYWNLKYSMITVIVLVSCHFIVLMRPRSENRLMSY